MLNISEIVRAAENLFDLLNIRFYDEELARPAITVSSDGGRGAFGWCSIVELWNTTTGESYYEINLTAEYLDRPMTEIAATMLHEMAHLYNIRHEIADTSNNGYYHNQRFKDTAEAHGLLIGKDAKYGWTITELEPEAVLWLREAADGMEINASRLRLIAMGGGDDETEGKGRAPKRGRATGKNRSIKYVCPECGAIVRATKELHIVCGDCMVDFERAQ